MPPDDDDDGGVDQQEDARRRPTVLGVLKRETTVTIKPGDQILRMRIPLMASQAHLQGRISEVYGKF